MQIYGPSVSTQYSESSGNALYERYDLCFMALIHQ